MLISWPSTYILFTELQTRSHLSLFSLQYWHTKRPLYICAGLFNGILILWSVYLKYKMFSYNIDNDQILCIRESIFCWNFKIYSCEIEINWTSPIMHLSALQNISEISYLNCFKFFCFSTLSDHLRILMWIKDHCMISF